MRCVQGVDPKQCVKCTIFNSSFIQRQQLENLSVNDLKFYFEDNRLPIPSVRSKGLLIEELLINQAKVLSQRALDSQEILQDPSVLGELNFLPTRGANPSGSNLPFVSSGAGNPNKTTVQESAAKEAKPVCLHANIPTYYTVKFLLPSCILSHIWSFEQFMSFIFSLLSIIICKPIDDSFFVYARMQIFVPGLVTNITDLTCADQIDLLPVKILKIILQRNCINYKGCVEKEELKDRVKRLWKAREKSKALEDKIAGDLGTRDHKILFYDFFSPL